MSAPLTSTRLRRRSACGCRHPAGPALVAVAVGLALVASLADANDGYFGGNGGPVVPLDHPDLQWWYRRKPGFRTEHLTATDRRSIALIEEAEAKLPPEPSPGN